MSTASTPMSLSPILRTCSLLVLPLLAACTSISPLPNQIPLYATTDQVKDIMGPPDYETEKPSLQHPQAALTYCYRDEWHRQPKQPDIWGSWDLYFDRSGQFIGWRLVEPVPSLDSAREELWRSKISTAPAPAGK